MWFFILYVINVEQDFIVTLPSEPLAGSPSKGNLGGAYPNKPASEPDEQGDGFLRHGRVDCLKQLGHELSELWGEECGDERKLVKCDMLCAAIASLQPPLTSKSSLTSSLTSSYFMNLSMTCLLPPRSTLVGPRWSLLPCPGIPCIMIVSGDCRKTK